MAQAAHQRINQDSGNTELYTPAAIVEAARATLGGFDLDPASSAIANETIRATRFFSEGALEREWSGRVWMNHPFSRTHNAQWIRKLVDSFKSGGGRGGLLHLFRQHIRGMVSPTAGLSAVLPLAAHELHPAQWRDLSRRHKGQRRDLSGQ